MKTIIVWFRADLRVHDHPALAAAAREAEHVVPVFVMDDGLLHSPHASSNRNRFLIESLADLQRSLKKTGAGLVVRHGDAARELETLAKETGAEAVYCIADYSPYALRRDKQAKAAMEHAGLTFKLFPGKLMVSELDAIKTKTGTVHKVFTPFWKTWQSMPRRDLAPMPRKLTLPSGIRQGTLPATGDVTVKEDLSPDVLHGGETAGRERLQAFIDGDLAAYTTGHNDLAADRTSRISPYLHFGCLSPREIETMLPPGDAAAAWHRQLAWREFYYYVLYHNPSNTTQEFQERYRSLHWPKNAALLKAWQEGCTGYPVVDAAMRQLNREGWMHNRGRLIVGSFLTKDLWLDWRDGEAYFMRKLLDGDTANNNGNWQWIASVGVDPAPVFRRVFNPSTQRDKFDPTGAYVRRYVPALQHVPDKYLSEPWKMPEEEQRKAGCIIGKDYPAPVVDHAEARVYALEQYRSTR